MFGARSLPSHGPVTADPAIDQLDPHTLRDLASVLPGMRAKVPDTPAAPVDPLLVCHSTRRALTALAARGQGLVIAVDDAHSIDEMTACVIGFWMRHGIDAPAPIATPDVSRWARRSYTGPPPPAVGSGRADRNSNLIRRKTPRNSWRTCLRCSSNRVMADAGEIPLHHPVGGSCAGAAWRGTDGVA